jgi:CRP/FNR family transcriptional regulator
MEKLPEDSMRTGAGLTAATAPALEEPQPPGCTQEDALAYLRCSTISVFKKGQVIFGPDQPSAHLYLVIDGRVKVSRLAGEDHEVVLDIYLPDEFFGESAFVSVARPEKAVALENTQVMMWSAAEIEECIDKRPRLGLAIVQMVVRRTLDFRYRLESLSSDSVSCRVARSLVRFSERLGRQLEDGSVLMPPLTHGLLAQYVGTSREIVTLYMTQFRRKGFLLYSRKGIILFRGSLKEWLRQNG